MSHHIVDENGVPEQFAWEWNILCDNVGKDNALKIVTCFAGMKVYFPVSVVEAKIKKQIIDAYNNGVQIKEIVQGIPLMTDTKARKIINSYRTKKNNTNPAQIS